MTTGGIELSHWARGWRGWVLLRETAQPWEGAAEKGESLSATLRAALAHDPVPAGTAVALVLAASAGGLSLLPDEAAELAEVMPFPPAETVHVVLPLAARKGARGLFWLHRDSVEEYAVVLGAQGLRLVDIFARAQMAAGYLTPAELRGGAAVIEADGSETVLHLYLPGGTPFRSARLPASDTPERRVGRVVAELAAADARGQHIDIVCVAGHGTLSDDLAPHLDAAVVAREAMPLPLLAERLWFSPREGIWLPPPRAELLAGFKRWAIGIAAVGAVLFAAMLWQTSRYEKEAGEFHTALKKLKPAYDKALQREQEAMRISETVRGVGDIEQLPRPLDPLALLAGQLPTGAWLTGFSYRQGELRVAGYAPDAVEVREKIAGLPGFTAMRPVAPPPAYEGAGVPFAFEGAWRPGSATPQVAAGAEGKGE